MKTVQRHENSFDYIWALIRSAYYFVLLPCAALVAAITLIIGLGSSFRYSLFATDYLLLSLLWMTILIPLGYRWFSINTRRKKLNEMVSMLSSTERFSPKKESLNAGSGKYLGIDTKHGNILYIHMVKKGVVNVIGLTMSEWTNRELEGSALRLYTRNTELPVLSISGHPNLVNEMFDILGAMSERSYTESFPQEPWPEYVGRQSRFVEFEHNVVVPQVV